MGKDKKTPKAEGAPGAPVVENCGAQTCKSKAARFGFCPEHYEQFKFGLITKAGAPVPDYEKKLDHYKDYLARKGMKKVA